MPPKEPTLTEIRNLDWQTKIHFGMQLIEEACQDHLDEHHDCAGCPFGDYCYRLIYCAGVLPPGKGISFPRE